MLLNTSIFKHTFEMKKKEIPLKKKPLEELIQDRMNEIGMTPKQLGGLIDKSKSQVNRYLSGTTPMTLDLARLIIRVIELDFHL